MKIIRGYGAIFLNYRHALIVAFGWLMLAASNQYGQQYRSNGIGIGPKGQPTASIHTLSQGGQGNQPAQVQCDDINNGKADCDIVAVKAAIDQAYDADLQADAAIAGVLIGLATLAAACGAVLWAKRAADAAVDGLGLSAAAIEQSSRNFSVENRPWISIENIQSRIACIQEHNGSNRITFVISYELVNYGRTPAVCVYPHIIASEAGKLEELHPDFYKAQLEYAPKNGAVVFPTERRLEGGTDGFHGAYGLEFNDGRKSAAIAVKIAVAYRDSGGLVCLTVRELMLCTVGSTRNRMGSFIFDNLNPGLNDAAVVEVARGNVAI